jgi:Uma2 family endonuclease
MAATLLDRQSDVPALQGKITYEEFLAYPWENPHLEWENGDVIVMSPVSYKHVKAARFLLRLIGEFAEITGLGEVLYEPFQMKTGPELPGRAPDVLYVASAHKGRIMDNWLDGPGDLVVEVLSPESRKRDRTAKYHEYEQGGVGEYWIVDPYRKQVEFYQLNDGVYTMAVVGADSRYDCPTLPGFWLKIDWIWRDPHPSVRAIAKLWNLPEEDAAV